MALKKVLIAGFGSVASELVQILPEGLYRVTGLRRSKTTSNDPRLRLLRVDLSDAGSLATAIQGETFDHLIYCPSPDKRDKASYQKTYLRGLENLLGLDGLIQNLKRLILISSTSVYGQSQGEWVDENSPTEPGSFSGEIILDTERMLASRMKTGFVILRCGGIYGKGDSRYVQQIKKGELRWYPSPQYINRIHVKDCASSIWHLMRLRSPQNLYLGVDDAPVDQREVISWMAEQLSIPIPRASAEEKDARASKMSNKRCKNDRLKKSGYQFLYPTYKDGYQSALGVR